MFQSMPEIVRTLKAKENRNTKNLVFLFEVYRKELLIIKAQFLATRN